MYSYDAPFVAPRVGENQHLTNSKFIDTFNIARMQPVMDRYGAVKVENYLKLPRKENCVIG